LCFASVVLAEETPKKDSDATAAELAEDELAQSAKTVEIPLHRHPTLFGMLRRNNSIRRRVGLFPHRINPALTSAAQDHANYMARTGQFSHYTNGGPQYRANKFGFRGGVRENIAYGTATIDGAFNMWQNSGAHYASIVSGTTEAGFGYAVSANGLAYWVGVYATPAQGDVTGETEDVVAQAVQEELKRKEAEKNLAQEQPTDSNVVAASAEVPETNPTGENPAGNANASNAQPGNYYYYNYSDSNRRRRWRRS
jgi:hypothetical protein